MGLQANMNIHLKSCFQIRAKFSRGISDFLLWSFLGHKHVLYQNQHNKKHFNILSHFIKTMSTSTPTTAVTRWSDVSEVDSPFLWIPDAFK